MCCPHVTQPRVTWWPAVVFYQHPARADARAAPQGQGCSALLWPQSHPPGPGMLTRGLVSALVVAPGWSTGSGHVSPPPAPDGTGHPCRGSWQHPSPLSLIPIFAPKPPPLVCPLPQESCFWLFSGSFKEFPCRERDSPMACVILLCPQRGRRVGGVLGTAGLRGGTCPGRQDSTAARASARGNLWGSLCPTGTLARRGWG